MAFTQIDFHGIHVQGPEGFTAAVLRMPGTNRILPIWIHPEEASEIEARISGFQPKRPASHDLLADALMRLTSGCQSVRINRNFEGVYIAALVTNDGEEIDARPSDAFILSRILELPIEIDDDVFMQASIFLSDADLAHYFGISSGVVGNGIDDHISASGDAQADADFEELMQSMGVFETDLLGENEASGGEGDNDDGESPGHRKR